MNKKEKEMASKLLDMASDELGNHGCNDVDEDFWEGWTQEERISFVKEYHDWNGDPEEFDDTYLHLPDFALMSFLAYKLKGGE